MMSQDNININVTENIDEVNIVASEVVEVVDLNLYATTEDVSINVTEEIIQVNINKITSSDITKTSDLINDGADGTSTYVETDELSAVAFSNDYNDLDNLPTIPEEVTKTSDLLNDGSDGVNPFITLEDIPSIVIDSVPTDGSSNAVSSNGVFDALATKENTITSGTTSQYFRGDKTFQTLDKNAVGLSNVDNTSDLNKPISTATQTALNSKQDSLGFTPENVANKSTSTSLGTSNTLYPTQNAVKVYADNQQFFYVHFNGFIQFTQDTVNFYGRPIGPQNIGWHTTNASTHPTNIGSSDLSVDGRALAISFPFNCQLEDVEIFLQHQNGLRDVKINFIGYTHINGSASVLNARRCLQISTTTASAKKISNTDYTISNATFNKGERITSVVNQVTNNTGVATNWDILLKFKKV